MKFDKKAPAISVAGRTVSETRAVVHWYRLEFVQCNNSGKYITCDILTRSVTMRGFCLSAKGKFLPKDHGDANNDET